jgi:tRNA U34 5-methylaminomethyl-2-thiouridine-forming methyltransferase MnmC
MRSNESKKITYIPILVHRDGFPAITSSKNTLMVWRGEFLSPISDKMEIEKQLQQ